MFGQKLNTKLLIHCLYYSFVKIRISNSNLNIEKGRYLNTPTEDRICKLYNSGVEDEFHFTIICSKLQSCREEVFKDICDVVTRTCFIQKIYAPSSSLLQGKHLPFSPSPLRLNICRLFVILSLTQLYRYTHFRQIGQE
jgi:hypothetical protein